MEIAKIEVFYVLEYPDGKYVAIDQDSGGYPYAVSSVIEAKQFKYESSAINYRIVFKRHGFKLKTVIATIGDYSER